MGKKRKKGVESRRKRGKTTRGKRGRNTRKIAETIEGKLNFETALQEA